MCAEGRISAAGLESLGCIAQHCRIYTAYDSRKVLEQYKINKPPKA